MKKSSFKFNFVDSAIVIIMLVVIVVVSLYFIVGNSAIGQAKNEEFTYEILFREVTEGVVDAVKKDAIVFDGNKNIEIGTVADFSVEDCAKYEFNAEIGEYVITKIPDRYNLTMKVSASGESNELCCVVNGYEVYVGKSVDLKSLGYVAHGYVVAVDER